MVTIFPFDWGWSPRMAQAFIRRAVRTPTIGWAFRWAKFDRLDSSCWAYSWDGNFNRYHAAAYHLLGDPKLDWVWPLEETAARVSAADVAATGRVAIEGPRIRVWLNRMHPSADPDKGLRLDVVDENEPILSGTIGVRTHNTAAWFDNIVALPCETPAPPDGS